MAILEKPLFLPSFLPHSKKFERAQIDPPVDEISIIEQFSEIIT